MTPRWLCQRGVGLGESKTPVVSLQAALDSGGAGAGDVDDAEVEGHEATQRQLRRSSLKGRIHGLSPKELLRTIP